MDKKNREARLRAMIGNLGDIEAITERLEGIRGLETVEASAPPAVGMAVAASGLRALTSDAPIPPEQLVGLEAIVMPMERPVVDVVSEDFQAPPPPWQHLGQGVEHDKLCGVIPSVGRIELPEHPYLPYGGTGFVVGDDLIMTNRHVAELFAEGVGVQGVLFRTGARAGIDFMQEIGSEDSRYLEIREVAMIHPHWDMALLRVTGLDGITPLTLSTEPPESMQGRDIVVLGYPAQDSRNDWALQNRIFRGVFNIKRLQPGRIRERDDVVSFAHWVHAVTHDASTLGGNSGSAVIDVGTGHVAGLHFSGRYLVANYAVPSRALARDPRVVDAGVRVSDCIATDDVPWRTAWATADAPTDHEAWLAADSPAATGNVATPVLPSPDVAQAEGTVTVTIPLQVTVSLKTLEGAIVPTVGVPTTPTGEAATYRLDPDADYRQRPGYDEDFLGSDHRIRMPWLTPDLFAKVAWNRWATRDRHVLPYHHFSLIMHRKRRLAMVTAVNIDGSQATSISRKTFSDRWFFDPRLPRLEQLDNSIYASNPLDRGHLVRRLDPTWGATPGEISGAHDDTFHWTNCSPQHEGFNRNKTTWGGIENHILDAAKAQRQRVTVFTGPVFGDDDPVYTTSQGLQVPLPEQYWKIVALVQEDGRLSATAYLLSQEGLIDAMMREVPFQPDTFQRTVREIEALSGMHFRPLRQFDPLDSTEAVEGGEMPHRKLDSLDDLIL